MAKQDKDDIQLGPISARELATKLVKNLPFEEARQFADLADPNDPEVARVLAAKQRDEALPVQRTFSAKAYIDQLWAEVRACKPKKPDSIAQANTKEAQ